MEQDMASRPTSIGTQNYASVTICESAKQAEFHILPPAINIYRMYLHAILHAPRNSSSQIRYNRLEKEHALLQVLCTLEFKSSQEHWL